LRAISTHKRPAILHLRRLVFLVACKSIISSQALVSSMFRPPVIFSPADRYVPDTGELSIVSWNQLLPSSVDGWWLYKQYCPITPRDQRTWDYRKVIFEAKLLNDVVKPDIICLQEASERSHEVRRSQERSNERRLERSESLCFSNIAFPRFARNLLAPFFPPLIADRLREFCPPLRLGGCKQGKDAVPDNVEE